MSRCVFCDKEIEGMGNSSYPISSEKCCDECNLKIVVPFRYYLASFNQTKSILEIGLNKLKIHQINPQKRYLKSDFENILRTYNVAFKNSPFTGLVLTFNPIVDKEVENLNKIATNALKSPYFGTVLLIPRALVKGGILIDV